MFVCDSVKAPSNVHISLGPEAWEDPNKATEVYLFIFGSYGNQKSEIRRGHSGKVLAKIEVKLRIIEFL